MKIDYKTKHSIANREALATLIAAALVMAFWWIAGLGLRDYDMTIFYMPAWFVIGSFGSWFFSVALCVFITKKVFKNFNLNDDSDESFDARSES